MAGHGLAALGVELGDAVRLDVLLAGEAELLLDGQLDGEAVAVPAGLAGHVVAAHGAEAREDVLEDARLDVVGARACRSRWAGPRRTPIRGGPRTAQGSWRRSSARARSRARRARGRAGRPGRAPGGTSALSSASFLRRTFCLPSEGREPVRLPSSRCGRRVRRAPAVPPSLALRRPVCTGEPPHWGRDAGSTGLGRCGCRLSSGGSGVIFASRSPPGFHRPRVALGRLRRYSSPSTLLAAPSVRRREDSGRPVFRGGPVACGVTRMARCATSGSWDAGLGGLPGGELGTTLAGLSRGTRGAGESLVCPVAAGQKSIYRPSTIREQDHNM